MRDPLELRELARRCQERTKSSLDPAAIEQLRRWAVELAYAADEIERNVGEPREATVHNILARRCTGDT
jgi:hypothetical protein